MSSFILTSQGEDGTPERVWRTPQSISTFMLAPKRLKDMGQLPQWATSIVVDNAGVALPVLETDEQIASLLAHASQNTWFGWRYEGDEIWGSFYNSESHGTEHRFEANVRVSS